MALLAVLLLLMLLSGLVGALAISATTETLMARNHQVAAQARTVADSGLAHGLALTLARLRGWSADGFGSPGEAVTALLRGPDGVAGSARANADNGSLEALGIVRPPGRVTLGNAENSAGAVNAAYVVRVLDDDDPALGRRLSTADVARIAEDGEAATDANALLVVRAIGYAGTTALPDAAGTAGGNAFAAGAAAASGAIAIVEASVALRRLPAIVTNGPLTLRETASIGGAAGSVHANGDLSLVGAPRVSGNATSSASVVRSGTPLVSGTTAGGRDTMPVPPVRAEAYRSRADFVLTAGGALRTAGGLAGGLAGGTVLCDTSSSATACADAGYAWVHDGVNGWSIPGTAPPPAGTYYVEGDVSIPGSPGDATAPARLTVIAEGSIAITGDPVMAPAAAGLLLVTDGDLMVTGAMRVAAATDARMLVREQAHVAGSAALAGQLLVENERHASSLVTANVMAGTATLTDSGAGGTSDFVVVGWRRVEVR